VSRSRVVQRFLKRGPLWLADGSCIRLRPQHRWFYDFVEDRTHGGHKYRVFNFVDEFTRGLASRVARKLKSVDASGVLSDLFMTLEGCSEVP
jgi:putative transposase